MIDAGTRFLSPSAARNRGPILDVLCRILPESARVLEIGAGTGEHAVTIAAALPGIDWQPSDPDAACRASISAWIDSEGVPNVRPPLNIDARSDGWNVEGPFDAVVSINMVHIAPWEAALGLFAGAERVLGRGGILFLYGPFMRDGRHTAASNAEFDASLKARDASWGVRDLADLVRVGKEHGFALRETVAMPANNMSLVFVAGAR